MNTEDKIYNKIKKASENGETPNFPGMEKVWSRVEDKLEAKVSKSETYKWKKMAVAAVFLVVGIITFNFYNSSEKINSTKSNDTTVTNTFDSVISNSNEVAVETATENNSKETNTKESFKKQYEVQPNHIDVVSNADEIIQEQIKQQPTVASANKVKAPFETMEETSTIEKKEDISIGYFNTHKKTPAKKNYSDSMASNFVAAEMAAPQEAYQARKEKPLIIMDGEAQQNMKVEDLDGEQIDSIVYLKNPLYIINGVEYSEQELFGPNPTSPYAPLNKQKITSTRIYQGEEAINLYGKKGKEGVIIISTQDAKPKK